MSFGLPSKSMSGVACLVVAGVAVAALMGPAEAAIIPADPGPAINPPSSFSSTVSISCNSTGTNVLTGNNSWVPLSACSVSNGMDEFHWAGASVIFMSTGPTTAFVYCKSGPGLPPPTVTAYNGKTLASSTAVVSTGVLCPIN